MHYMRKNQEKHRQRSKSPIFNNGPVTEFPQHSCYYKVAFLLSVIDHRNDKFENLNHDHAF